MSVAEAAPRSTVRPSIPSRESSLLRPEEQLLFRLAAPRQSAEAVRALVAGGIDWDRFITLVLNEGVTGGVWRVLHSLDVPIPTAAAAQLQGVAALSDFRLLEVRRLLERTVSRMTSRGIEVMLVKGAALASFVYPDPCDRNMADMDLVVPADRAREAAVVAQEVGWSLGGAELKEALYEDHHHLPPMSDTVGLDIRLEIHTDVLPKGHPLHFGVEALRARAVSRGMGGASVLLPSMEDLLLYSCIHLGWSHEMRVGGWRTFRDVSEIVAQPGFSWDRFVALAGERTLAPACYWTLELASRLCGTPVPSPVLRALQPSLPEWVRSVVARHNTLQLMPLSGENPSEALARAIWTIGMRPKRSGHGEVRPWHHSDHKIKKSHELGLDASAPPSERWWANPLGIRATLSYVRRLMSR